MRTVRFAGLAMAAAILYQLLLIVLILLRPDLPPYSTTISEWAIGRFGWLMQTAFFISALSYLFLFVAIKDEVRGGWGKAGLFLLLVCFIGTAGVGSFITNPYPPDFRIPGTLVHTICGTTAMILFPFAALLISRNIAGKNEDWLRYRTTIRWLAFLPLLAFVGFLIHLNIYVIPLGEKAVGKDVPVGYPPRVMFLVYHLWLIAFSGLFINVKTYKFNSNVHCHPSHC